MAEVPAGPTFAVPEPPPPPTPAEPPPPAPPPWKAGGWNDPRGAGGRDGNSGIRWGPVVVFGILFLAIAGVVAFLFITPSAPPRPDLVVVPLYRYVHPALPVNAWAERDADRLTACFPPEEGIAPTKRKGLADDSPAAFQSDVLDGLKNQKPDRPFVLAISGTAITHEGKVYILLADGDPARPTATGVPLQTILDALASCPAKFKLLTLDVARPLTYPIVGPFRADPAGGIHTALANAVLPCPVLVSCSPGEVSHAMGPEGASAFGFYLADGLRGAADGSDPDKPGKDRKVSVRELGLFVSARVNRWVKRMYDANQTPRMYAQGFDGPGFTVSVPELVVEPAPGPTTGVMMGAWGLRDSKLVDLQARFPMALARFNAGQLRTDALAGAGEQARADDERRKAETRLEEELGTRAKSLPTLLGVPSLNGLPDNLTKGTPAADEAAAKLRRAVETYWGKATAKPLPKPDERVMARGNLREAAGDVPVAVAKLLVKRIIDAGEISEAATKDASAMLVDLLRGQPITGELLLFRKAADQPEETALLSVKALPALLQAESAFAAAGNAGREVFFAVRTLLEDIDKVKQTAESTIFLAASTGETNKAIETLKKVVIDCELLERQAAALVTLRATTEKSLALLVNTAVAAGEDSNWYEDWRALAEALRPVAGDAPIDAAFSTKPLTETPDTLIAANARVTRAHDKLLARVNAVVEAVEKLRKAESVSPAEVKPLRLVLMTPVLPEPKRRIVFDTLLVCESKLHEHVRKTLDETEDSAEKGYPRQPPGPPATDLLAARAAQARVNVSVVLLRVGGVPVTGLDTAGTQAAGDDPASANTATEKFRKAWANDVIKKMETETAKGNLATAELLSRVVPPAVAAQFAQLHPSASPGQQAPPAPADRARRQSLADFANWQVKHYGAYQLLRPTGREFYQLLARSAGATATELAK